MNGSNQRIDTFVTLHHEAIEFWYEHVRPWVLSMDHKVDEAVLRGSWLEYVDRLYRTCQISTWQRCNWSEPDYDKVA